MLRSLYPSHFSGMHLRLDLVQPSTKSTVSFSRLLPIRKLYTKNFVIKPQRIFTLINLNIDSMSFQIKKKMLLSKILVIIHVSLIKPKKSLSFVCACR